MLDPMQFQEDFHDLVTNLGVSEDVIMKTLGEALRVAYKKTYEDDDNIETRTDQGRVFLVARRTIVDDVLDPATEISLEEARQFLPECEIDQEVMVEVNPNSFGMRGAHAARQVLKQRFREIRKDAIFSEYHDKIGTLITGKYQRDRYGDIYLDVGKTEALLPRSHRLPNENFSTGDQVKAVLIDVSNDPGKHTPLVISRTDHRFVEEIFRQEVPEIDEGQITIVKAVREPGYRTKIAVHSDFMDPVGACVGPKGIRIQSITAQLMGERVDIVRYSENIREYIEAALTPAELERVMITDGDNKQAVAVVHEEQLAKAIGKSGRNVKLAAMLIEWNLDVMTPARVLENNIVDSEVAAGNVSASDIWRTDGHDIELLEFPEKIEAALRESGLDIVETLVEYSKAQVEEMTGLNKEEVSFIFSKLEEMVEVEDESSEPEEEKQEVQELEDEVVSFEPLTSPEPVAPEAPSEAKVAAAALFSDEEITEDQEAEAIVEASPEAVSNESTEATQDAEEEEMYLDPDDLHCPTCGAPITLEMEKCDACGTILEFEFEDEEEEVEEEVEA